jgi:hypothetical protein
VGRRLDVALRGRVPQHLPSARVGTVWDAEGRRAEAEAGCKATHLHQEAGGEVGRVREREGRARRRARVWLARVARTRGLPRWGWGLPQRRYERPRRRALVVTDPCRHRPPARRPARPRAPPPLRWPAGRGGASQRGKGGKGFGRRILQTSRCLRGSKEEGCTGAGELVLGADVQKRAVKVPACRIRRPRLGPCPSASAG